MAYEPFPNYPSLADAIDDAAQLTIRWGHDSVRNLSRAQVAAIVTALRATPSETATAERDKDAARWRWLRDDALQVLVHGPVVCAADKMGNLLKDGDLHITMDGKELDKAVDDAMRRGNSK